MVGSTSPHSDPLSLAVAGDAAIDAQTAMNMHVSGHRRRSRQSQSRHQHHQYQNHNAADLTFQNAHASSSRALRARAGPSLITNSDSVIAVTTTTAANSNRTTSTASMPVSSNSGHPTSGATPILASSPGSSQPTTTTIASALSSGSSQPTTIAHAPASGMPVTLIIVVAVGGAIAIALLLALIYYLRIRRRNKRMKRCTDILGPELAPMSPSESSQFSFDSRPRHDRTRSIISPSTSDPNKQFLPLRTSIVPSLTSIEQHPRPREPRYPLRISTTSVGPPPAARRARIPSLEPRSPIRSSLVTMTWRDPTSQSGYSPENDHGERHGASSD